MALGGALPRSSVLAQMLWVTSKVEEGASHWGKTEMFTNQD